MESLKSIALVVVLAALGWWLWRKFGHAGACCMACAGGGGRAGKRLPDVPPPSSAGGLRAGTGRGCGPFACGR